LIDEAVGKVMAAIKLRGWDGDTDVLFTTDHGEFQGDFGLLFKGPHHVTSLMHLPMIWRPAPNARIAPQTIDAPVGQVDFAPTFCEIAGVEPGTWMEGAPLPRDAKAADDRETVFTEWDSEHNGISVSLRTLYRDDWIITAYGKSSIYEGTEGELYDLNSDPMQWRNLWDDPAAAALKKSLLEELRAKTPKLAEPHRPAVASV
jgi:arylsulfatase A-like enzyme